MRRTDSLRHGYTTGACAAAAAKGAALILREQQPVAEVELVLPIGETARFRLHGQRLADRSASCFVIKDAGDDPDVTHGAEIHATIEVEFFTPNRLEIVGGRGIGRVTKPGLAVPPGEWAINPVPRRMIREAVREVFAMRCMPAAFTVTIAIPDGEERARRTLNARLGIVGGLSILGTTGIVRPLSHQAWTDTIDAALDVARACGCRTAVLSTGRTSELAAQQFFRDPGPGTRDRFKEESFIMMGDHVGHALEACRRRGFAGIVLAAQFAKLAKIACGHRQTHAALSRLDLAQLAGWARAAGLDAATVETLECAHTAREAFLNAPDRQGLARLVAGRALAALGEADEAGAVAVLLVDYDGQPAGWFGPREEERTGP